jgi:ribose-phosphate pyrophosphokinase
MNKLVVFSGTGNPNLSQKILKKLKISPGKANISRFSDGEVRVEIGDNVRGKDVFVIQPTCPPVSENLVELMIILDALRRASAQRITAVVPYFGYARQDRKDMPRVPITAKLIANILTGAGADRVLTLDLHAGQIQGFFDIPLDHLYAINVFSDYFIKISGADNLTIVSPDVGGIKMARAYAKRFNAGLAIVDKRRNSPDSTEVMHILGDVDGSNVLLVDDMISTGSSLVQAAKALKAAGAKKIYAAITHGILCGDALSKIDNSCIDFMAITDSIPLDPSKKSKKIKVVSVDSLFAEAIKRIHFEQSISVLFDEIGR